MSKNAFSRFENLVQSIIEDSFGGLFGRQLEPVDIAGRLLIAIEKIGYKESTPPRFDLLLNIEDYQNLLTDHQNLELEIVALTRQLSRRTGMNIKEGPILSFKGSPAVRRGKVQITSVMDNDIAKEHTKAIPSMPAQEEDPANSPVNADAFLIIQGRRHIKLVKDLITIGRLSDNDIVLDANTVSRMHAQIRWRFGRYVIYDVGKRGRTKVNGVPINEHVLKSGDVISLSDILIIYGEGLDYQPDSQIDSGENNDETMPFK